MLKGKPIQYNQILFLLAEVSKCSTLSNLWHLTALREIHNAILEDRQRQMETNNK